MEGEEECIQREAGAEEKGRRRVQGTTISVPGAKPVCIYWNWQLRARDDTAFSRGQGMNLKHYRIKYSSSFASWIVSQYLNVRKILSKAFILRKKLYCSRVFIS